MPAYTLNALLLSLGASGTVFGGMYFQKQRAAESAKEFHIDEDLDVESMDIPIAIVVVSVVCIGTAVTALWSKTRQLARSTVKLLDKAAAPQEVVAAENDAWYIAALKNDHPVLGIYYGHDKAFTRFEQIVFLIVAIAAAWIGVYLKHFYFHVVDAVNDEYDLFDDDWIINHIDSAVCGALGSAVDIVLGVGIVKMILKKNWEKQDGVKGFVNASVVGYALILGIGALIHFAHFIVVAKTSLFEKLAFKFMGAVVMKLVIIESMKIIFLNAFKSRNATGVDIKED